MSDVAQRFGWWLMGLPVGLRRTWRPLLQFGPYRWGAWLFDRGYSYQVRKSRLDPEQKP